MRPTVTLLSFSRYILLAWHHCCITVYLAACLPNFAIHLINVAKVGVIMKFCKEELVISKKILEGYYTFSSKKRIKIEL